MTRINEPNPPYCDRCGTIQEPTEDNLVVGEYRGEDVCQICLRDQLHEETFLSERESFVAAMKLLTDMTHNEIAAFVDREKSTIDEYSRRINAKADRAARTVDVLDHVN